MPDELPVEGDPCRMMRTRMQCWGKLKRVTVRGVVPLAGCGPNNFQEVPIPQNQVYCPRCGALYYSPIKNAGDV